MASGKGFGGDRRGTYKGAGKTSGRAPERAMAIGNAIRRGLAKRKAHGEYLYLMRGEKPCANQNCHTIP
jgi:hypothetical protein